MSGSSECRQWVTGGKTRRELCSPDCLKERTLSGAHSIFSEATRTADSRVLGRAIPCSAVAQQRHKIIRNRLALLRDESVSGVTVGTAPTPTGDPLLRIYIIGKDGARCAARRRRQSMTARLPLHRTRSCTLPRSAPSGAHPRHLKIKGDGNGSRVPRGFRRGGRVSHPVYGGGGRAGTHKGGSVCNRRRAAP